MTSLVAYDDSDSEAEADNSNSSCQEKRIRNFGQPLPCDTLATNNPQPRWGNLNTGLGIVEEYSRVCGLLEPQAERNTWKSCPGPRCQWPNTELQVKPCTFTPSDFPTSPSSTSSGNRELAGASVGKMRPSCEAFRVPNSSSCALMSLEATSQHGSLLQKRRWENMDFVKGGIKPYIPKRLRQTQTLTAGTSERGGSELQRQRTDCPSFSEGFPMRECTATVVSDFIKPYLDGKYKSTEIPKKVIFQMSEHGGPVNSVQWCPVLQHSHMLLSASMDKTFKVWDAIDTGHCLNTYSSHSGAVRAAQWSSFGRQILSGGFDSELHVTDVETGTQLLSCKNEFRISTVKFNPNEPNVFLCGGFSPEIKAWDMRSCKVIKVYKASVQQTLDILFLRGGNEFLSSTDSVSRDSADRTIIAWDFHSAAKVSNQIFHERFTCPSLTLHPKESLFVAQTNGNYMALFSALRPYRINKRKRYEGHKVEGYAVACECSPDGGILVTGSADGNVFFYNYHNPKIICTFPAHSHACVGTTFHPLLSSVLATCDWSGKIKVWQ
ncbi:WD repeat-containing protein 25 [Phascolarctos cinereus]|uniref:WD repeat-containing protein 25 isoform X1 n=1 Tax=Phascolarctos cinereus TaxID=38626 RepID=A0A6P5M3C2_PHACI|nr:WD repeat-containing protein 25 isoform X1 [Phascolarctos cinereus]XP_020862999.1 WD repeat-containing protein 25 isoform X1 [Phascolarctos cinereus]